MRALAERCEATGIRAPVDSVYPLEGFRDAFEKLERGRPRGKVVLEMG